MRRIIWGAFLLAALSTGVFLPRWAAELDDLRQMQAEISYSVSSQAIAQGMAWEFPQRLANASRSMTQMETEHEGVMDEAAAEAAARGILGQMEETGVLTPGSRWQRERAEQYLMIGRESVAVTGVEQLGGYYAWLCSFSNAAGTTLGLLVDDETGLLLAAGLVCGEGEELPLDTMHAALSFGAFCEESYGFTLRTVRRLPDAERGRARYELTFFDGTDHRITLSWSMGRNAMKYQAMVAFQ